MRPKPGAQPQTQAFPGSIGHIQPIFGTFLSSRQPSLLRYQTMSMLIRGSLVLENKRYSFFHEGFFDYAFARRFAGSSQSLVGLLLSSEQHLFRRAQVRQILLYLRGTEFDRYIANLEEVLSSPDVRFHVKQVILALLADLSEPAKREWNVLSGIAGGNFSDPVTRNAWMAVRRPPWFRLVDSEGLVQQWLADPDEAFVDQTVSLLRVIQGQFPDRVAELVEPYVGKSELWNRRLLHLAEWGDWSQGRRFLELMLRLIDEGVLDDARGSIAVNSEFWDLLYRLQYNNQSWGCEVAGHYFKRQRQLSLDAGEPNPFSYKGLTITGSQSAGDVLDKLASNAPGSFVLEVMPFMAGVIEDCASQGGGGPLLDSIWSHRIFQSGFSIKDALLKAMETALSKLAIQHPEIYRSVIGPLRESPFETVQYLLIRSFASNGVLFADEGVSHLCEKPERLQIGYLSDPHWATRQLIESISPHCSDEKLRQLETLLLGYYSDWERSIRGRQQYGSAQFTLLSGIVAARRSRETNRRLEKLGRKFGRPEPVAQTPIEAEWVRSPIPEEAAHRMGDEHWLSAIRKHDEDKDELKQDGHFAGGALELSRILENEVKQDAKRFAELVLRFPDDANPSYFEAVLRGISDATLDLETIVRVCERCHRIEGRPLGGVICRPIANSAQGNVPTEALDLVAWYATEDPDPDAELWRSPVRPGGDYYYQGDVLQNGINTVRGTAAMAVAKLIDSDPRRIAYLNLNPPKAGVG